ncbi:40935_t:CDS:2, partial [Gigaspora margarita]
YNTEGTYISLSEEAIIKYNNISLAFVSKYSIRTYTNLPKKVMIEYNYISLLIVFYYNIDGMCINLSKKEAYLSNIYEYEKEYQAQQAIDFKNNNNNYDSDKKNTSISIKLKNLLKVFTKGRPKLSAYHNDNIVNQQKAKNLTCDKQRRSYYCSYFKNKEHNVATCLEKDKDT